MTLTFDILTSTFIGVIHWSWPIFLPSRMTVTYKHFKILSGHGFCIKCYCDIDLWPSYLKIYRGYLQVWPIFLLSTMTVPQIFFKILTGHDVAYGRTDGRTDAIPSTSKVSLRAYQKLIVMTFWFPFAMLFHLVYFTYCKICDRYNSARTPDQTVWSYLFQTC